MALTCLLALVVNALAAELPIYLSDSHAGSFAFFASELDFDEEYTLILIDAHSDASGVFASDRLRTGLRSVLSLRQRASRAREWVENGEIQPFSWIEPLMPEPIQRVIWVAGEDLSGDELATKQAELAKHLNWQTQLEPRACGMLDDRFKVVDWQGFEKLSLAGKLVLSIDLDYYAQPGFSADWIERDWRRLSSLPDVKAASISISRPWLADDQQAYQFVEAILDEVFLMQNVDIQLDAFLLTQLDRSMKAKEYLSKGLEVPRLQWSESPDSLRQLILQNLDRIEIPASADRWKTMISSWQAEMTELKLGLANFQPDLDGVWRLHQRKLSDLWLTGQTGEYEKVRWWRLQPAEPVYNLLRDTRLGKGFTGDAGSFVSLRRQLVAETDDLALAATSWADLLPAPGVAGVLKLQAEVVAANGASWSTPIEIRVRDRDGIAGSLIEQLGSPYVFGIGKLMQGQSTGAETLVGNDCANFLVYAMRRHGYKIPWSNPAQIKRYLFLRQEGVSVADRFQLDQTHGHSGWVIHLGSHVAYLWQDVGELGFLDADDLVIHHLSGYPEIISLEELLKGRSRFDIYELPDLAEDQVLAFGGDVNLQHYELGDELLVGELSQQVEAADFFMVNLECSLGGDEQQVRGGRFQFVIDDGDKLRALVDAGVDVVSLANNHAMDGGVGGLKLTLDELRSLGVIAVGAGENVALAATPVVESFGSVKVAVVAVNAIGGERGAAGEASAGVLSWPKHKDQLAQSLARANELADFVVVMPHWGAEYTSVITPLQRDLARWLVDHGADAVVGSHSHMAQRAEYFRGVPIVYSLGNLYFPNQSRIGFNDYQVLSLALDRKHGFFIKCWRANGEW
ncbi:CapA family protein [Persicirhabdus sediminis]|uniref:CapA family protein n=1 Tax=Persicirhabdus sediminis TaxID=454144 RepID=A0A8J7MDU2_9BACT|nr:CapA family protein [Persicirhabdus sediminis]MBK1791157.1 CapA family protein [Persicirhabdus sediminis]